MTDKELRHLSRGDLLQLLLDQSRRLSELEAKYETAHKALLDKKIKLEKAGSIAEAALSLNGVFEAAEAACRQYTENVAVFEERQAQIEKASAERADAIIKDAEKRAEIIVSDAKAKRDAILRKAESEARSYWDEINEKLNLFLSDHDELRTMLSSMPKSGGGINE